jgi:hypothetical protein
MWDAELRRQLRTERDSALYRAAETPPAPEASGGLHNACVSYLSYRPLRKQ